MNFAWEMIWGFGVVALFGALIYGTIQYKTRNRANDRITEKATHELYSHPDTYARERKDLQKQIKPS